MLYPAKLFLIRVSMASACEANSFVHYSRIIDESANSMQTRGGGAEQGGRGGMGSRREGEELNGFLHDESQSANATERHGQRDSQTDGQRDFPTPPLPQSTSKVLLKQTSYGRHHTESPVAEYAPRLCRPPHQRVSTTLLLHQAKPTKSTN